MKIGDLVRYSHDNTMGVVFYISPEGDIIKMVTTAGLESWCIIAFCEVISENR